ncbi:MAG TPA: TolC family protein, partial [Bacteroidales bacterium]|nr:TolC family protein [Bacteroidales bacterium]
ARRPVFYAFGQAGAGMPGYNMLNSEFDTYYIVGAGLHWKIWDWNKVKRERQMLEKSKQMLENKEETFELNVESSQAKEIRKMEQLRKSLDLDDKMLQMRIELTSVAESELNNGIISASEYIQTLNNESITRISRARHHIELMKAIATYNLLQGLL